ncbi:MAG TPA: N-acyl homoserine lactonase family protein [Polyangiaceae bacterium]|nr:N-acyl homoserine lactonase family protein [Polyangiaceae bacterium]
MKNWTLFGCIAAVLSAVAACGGEKPANSPPSTSASEQGATSTTPAATAQEGIRLYVFDCGNIDVLDVSAFHPEYGKGEKTKLAATCYLIKHPKGTLQWDTGLSDGLLKVPEGKNVGFAVLHVTKGLAAQYQELGIAPDSVNFVGISHMHSDHSGNLNLFPHATVLMQKEEYEAAFSADPSKYRFDPTAYPTLKANPVKKLEGDLDVFGDGTVVVKREIGHTPGHQVLFLKLPKTGNIVLSGDLVHFAENWTKRNVPGFNFDKQESIKAMADVDQFLKANHATLWIQHDYPQNQTIKHAPAYYE